MSSVGSLSSSTSSSIFNSSNRITGLASGLDTDALIESMTAATRSKIAKQNQDKQLLQWKMDDYRSISSKLIDFQNKYLSYSSSTNLRSPSFFDKSILSVLGENSKYVSVSGTSSNIDNISIAAVEQLAKNSSYVSSNPVSNQTLIGDEVKAESVSTELEGTSIKISYGNKTYTLSISDLKTSDEVEGDNTITKDLVEKLNAELADIDYSGGGKLSEKIKFEIDESSNKISLKELGTAGNSMEIKGGSEELLEALGFEEGSKASGGKIEGGVVTDDVLEKYEESISFGKMVSGPGKTLSFTYNGTTKKIELPESSIELGKFGDENDSEMEKFANYLEKELGKAFGSGRIDVDYTKEGKFEFKTVLAGVESSETVDNTDTSSVLKFNYGDTNATKALGLTDGDSNRVNMNASVAESGLNLSWPSTLESSGDKNKEKDFRINILNNATNEVITINKTVDGKEFDENTSLSDIIEAINASDANVEVTYSEISDKFTLTSKELGASGNFSIIGDYEKDSNGNIVEKLEGDNLGTAIFGTGMKPPSDKNSTKTENGSYTYTKGQDAIVWVDYDGEGGAGPVQVTRSSNTFNIDGLNVTVNGTFGMQKDDNGAIKPGQPDPNAEAVTFSGKVDTEKITEAVKAMIEAFNEIIKLSNDEVSEKKNRDYPPLTDEQKEEMTEDQIKAWEEKAKAGMLFNDSDLRNFTSSIRFIFSGDSETMKLLSDMGIETSSNFSDHGKINFDETKFKAALETNPDIISDLFTRTGETTVDSEGNPVTKSAGLMNQIKTVFDKYASTTGATKGIFVQMAGATESPLSMLDNFILDQMNDIDDEIEKLQDKLEMETERYYKQFTSLETFISQMNSQSSWLSSQFSY